MEQFEKGMTRRHTFFCINRARHTADQKVVAAVPKEIEIFGKKVQGWLITTEEIVIDKVIPLRESLQEELLLHDPE